MIMEKMYRSWNYVKHEISFEIWILVIYIDMEVYMYMYLYGHCINGLKDRRHDMTTHRQHHTSHPIPSIHVIPFHPIASQSSSLNRYYTFHLSHHVARRDLNIIIIIICSSCYSITDRYTAFHLPSHEQIYQHHYITISPHHVDIYYVSIPYAWTRADTNIIFYSI